MTPLLLDVCAYVSCIFCVLYYDIDAEVFDLYDLYYDTN